MTAKKSSRKAFAEDVPLPLGRHLEELRGRVLWVLATAAVFSAACYFFTDAVINRMSRTVGTLYFLSPTEAFMARIKIAVILGVFTSMPVMLYHVWKFIGLALTVDERRVVAGALPFSYLLFAAGAALAWFVIVPTGLEVLLSFASDHVRPMISVESCLEFTLWISAGLGLLFQIPVVVGALARWGIVRSQTLAHYRRHAIIAILVISAMVTPGPDVVSQLLLAVPTYALFELSLLLARALQPD